MMNERLGYTRIYDGPDDISTHPVYLESGIAVEEETPLTKAFASAEWKALKKLRIQIPDIFEEIFPNAQKSVELWGVTIGSSNLTDPKVSVVLMKFLRARNLNVQAARQMIIETLRWRAQLDIEAVMAEQFPEEVFGNSAYIHGMDKAGRPVLYTIAAAGLYADAAMYSRWRVQFHEKAVRLVDFKTTDQIVHVEDYLHGPYPTPEVKTAGITADRLLSSYYPATLNRKIVMNLTAYHVGAFRVFKTFVRVGRYSNLYLVGKGDAIPKALLTVIDKDELPTKYGGEADGF